MIVSCEHCHTRYLVAAHLLLPEGRRVRCAGCHHEWFQTPVEEDDDGDIGAADEMPFSLPPEPDDETSFEPLPDSILPRPEDRLPVAVTVAAKPQGKGQGVQIVGSMVTAIVLFCAGAAGLVHFKGEVVRTWAPAFALYEALHIDVPLLGRGLALDHIEAVSQPDGALKVTGRIINLTRADLTVPPFVGIVRGADGTELARWRIEPPVAFLGKEADTAFETTYPALPDAAQDVFVGFALDQN